MKVEIGPGNSKISQEWITVGDFEREGIVDHVCSWGHEPLPFKDGECDLIYSSHCLEHVPWYKVDYALQECNRVLKKDGELEIHVPNIDYIISCYNERKFGDEWNKFNNREHHVIWLASRMISYGPTLSNYHKSCYNEDYLRFALTKNGFKDIQLVENGRPHFIHGPINIGVKAKK